LHPATLDLRLAPDRELPRRPSSCRPRAELDDPSLATLLRLLPGGDRPRHRAAGSQPQRVRSPVRRREIRSAIEIAHPRRPSIAALDHRRVRVSARRGKIESCSAPTSTSPPSSLVPTVMFYGFTAQVSCPLYLPSPPFINAPLRRPCCSSRPATAMAPLCVWCARAGVREPSLVALASGSVAANRIKSPQPRVPWAG